MNIVVLGLSITSSWGNGHATTYRALLRALAARQHQITFLERDVPWYAAHRDLPAPSFCRTELYQSLEELRAAYERVVASADVVIIGSYVPQGIAVADWVFAAARGLVAFYDIDTPVTLANLQQDAVEYLSREQIARYDLYLSFTGGPTLQRLEREFGARAAKPLYCSVDPSAYYRERVPRRWDLGYMGTYSVDRQPAVERLLLEPARRWVAGRFALVGPQYPVDMAAASNVEQIQHLPPQEHRGFYNAQRFTLNVTRRDMIAAGYSPSVRLFEAAACATPVISDEWAGLDSFFEIGSEIMVARTAEEVLTYLHDFDEQRVQQIGTAAQRRVLAEHTAAQRALQLESYLAGIPLAQSA